jgi:hypothetical protein
MSRTLQRAAVRSANVPRIGDGKVLSDSGDGVLSVSGDGALSQMVMRIAHMVAVYVSTLNSGRGLGLSAWPSVWAFSCLKREWKYRS